MRLIAGLSLLAVFAETELRLEPAGNPIRVVVEKTRLYSGKRHVFEFPNYTGSVRLTENGGAVELTVDAARFELLDDWVSASDRKKIVEYTASDKVLDTGRHPAIRFQSTSAESAGPGQWQVQGNLELRGVTRPIEFSVKQSGAGPTKVFEGRASFSMKLFGIQPPTAALGLVGTKEELTIEFRLEGVAGS